MAVMRNGELRPFAHFTVTQPDRTIFRRDGEFAVRWFWFVMEDFPIVLADRVWRGARERCYG
jgi:hypothetical protein